MSIPLKQDAIYKTILHAGLRRKHAFDRFGQILLEA